MFLKIKHVQLFNTATLLQRVLERLIVKLVQILMGWLIDQYQYMFSLKIQNLY
jgi:hypothetical protein